MNCGYCSNYMTNIGSCKFCHFEADRIIDDKFDILHLDEDEWEHIQVMDQLKKHNIEYILADMWDNILFIIGCKASDDKIAKALDIPKSVIYNDYEHMLVIVNLFQLKYIREEL